MKFVMVLKNVKYINPLEKKKLVQLTDAGGNFLANRKDHLKTAKSWKKLDIKQNIGDNFDIEKGNTRPKPIRYSSIF